jgi:hypothetical protein
MAPRQRVAPPAAATTAEVPTSATANFNRSGLTPPLLHHPTASAGLFASTQARSHEVGFVVPTCMHDLPIGPPDLHQMTTVDRAKAIPMRGGEGPTYRHAVTVPSLDGHPR